MELPDIVKEIELARGKPARLEEIFRQITKEHEPLFKKAIAVCAARYPEDMLFHAWELRLEVRGEHGRILEQWQPYESVWLSAVGLSVVLGLLFMLAADGAPPLPFAFEAGSSFWLWWPILLGTMLMAFFFFTSPSVVNWRQLASAFGIILLMSAFASVHSIGSTDQRTFLASLHLPFVAWATVATVYMWGMQQRRLQVFSFMKRSVVVCIAAGLYYAVGGLFIALAFGIFGVLGIRIPEEVVVRFAAWGVGMVPLLAVASVYDPQKTPLEQEQDHGIATILSFITRLFLPLVFSLLLVYIFWFIPVRFWEPFKNRELLVIYNATIIAVLVLLTHVPSEGTAGGNLGTWLRKGMLGTVALTALLNIYAFAAVLTRTIQGGLTVNRHAVLGWNMATLIMLGMLFTALIRQGEGISWVRRFQSSFAQSMVFPVAWAVWVLLVMPIFK